MTNNSISGSYLGFYVTDSPGVVITGNYIVSTTYSGAHTRRSDGCVVSDNAVSDSNFGISVELSDGVSVANNSVGPCWWGGILLNLATNALLRVNSMTGCGLYLYGEDVSQWDTHDIDLSNTVDGKPTHYIVNHDGPLTIVDPGQIVLVGCSNATLDSFVLRNASIGIELALCSGITATNNDCSDNYAGVDVFSSVGCRIALNNCSGSDYGVGMSDSNDMTVSDNDCSNTTYGVYSFWSSDNEILRNDLNESTYGIYMERSDSNLVSANEFRGCAKGAHLIIAPDNTFTNNTFTDCVVGIDADNGPESARLTVNYNAFTSMRECSVYLWSDHGTMVGNTFADSYWGAVAYGSRWLVVQENTFVNSSLWIWGLLIEHWTTHTIDASNTVNGRPVFYAANQDAVAIPDDVGEIILAGCTDSAASDHTFSLTSVGMLLGFCTNISVVNNTFLDSRDGLYAYECDDCYLGWNTFDNNDWAMDADYCEGNMIANNTLSHCIGYALGMILSGDNTVTGNNFSSNGGYAIQLSGCNGNMIWNNSFSYNNGAGDAYDPDHVQALDSGGNNQWYDCQAGQYHGFGNYWKDWTSPDDDFDYVVDVPYAIDGSSGESDLYPLTSPEVPNVQIPEFGPFAVTIALASMVVLLARRLRS
jgi:parallel beta-helix repeat protein